MLLIEYFLDKLNEENVGKFWKERKSFSAGAKNALLNHQWTGNIRELQNTILRVTLTVKSTVITEADVKRALFVFKDNEEDTILSRSIGNDFSLPQIISEVACHYLNRAMKEANQNKTKAAELVGLRNYQTLDNWLRKYQPK